MLGTILLEAPPWLSASAVSDGTVELQWGTSPSAAAREVGYIVLRRQVGAASFLGIARTTAVTYTDAPAPATYEYVVRTAASTFASPDSPRATVTTGP